MASHTLDWSSSEQYFNDAYHSDPHSTIVNCTLEHNRLASLYKRRLRINDMMWLWIGNVLLNDAVANNDTVVESSETETTDPAEVIQPNQSTDSLQHRALLPLT